MGVIGSLICDLVASKATRSRPRWSQSEGISCSDLCKPWSDPSHLTRHGTPERNATWLEKYCAYYPGIGDDFVAMWARRRDEAEVWTRGGKGYLLRSQIEDCSGGSWCIKWGKWLSCVLDPAMTLLCTVMPLSRSASHCCACIVQTTPTSYLHTYVGRSQITNLNVFVWIGTAAIKVQFQQRKIPESSPSKTRDSSYCGWLHVHGLLVR